jgi:hypothetical protein
MVAWHFDVTQEVFAGACAQTLPFTKRKKISQPITLEKLPIRRVMLMIPPFLPRSNSCPGQQHFRQNPLLLCKYFANYTERGSLIDRSEKIDEQGQDDF